MKIRDLTVVAPMLHEEDNVNKFMDSLVSSLENNAIRWKVIVPVMKDDPTIEYLRRYPVQLVDRPLELGSAFRKGMKQALECPGPVLTMVSDLSNVPEEMGRLLQTKSDIVIGARGPEVPRRFFSRLVNGVLLGPCTDYTNAYRLYTREVIEKVLPQMKSRGFAFLPEFIFRAIRAGFRVTEVQVTHPSRVGGYSKLIYRRNLHEYARLLVWRYLFANRPTV